MEVSTILITQARLGSKRLPGKVLKEIEGQPLLKIHLDRLNNCTKVSEIIVATTTNEQDNIIYKKSIEWGYKAYKGSEMNVLDRYYQVAKLYRPKWVVRVTSDCPLLDPILVDEVIAFVQESNMDYGSNTIIEDFPDGQDIEVFKFSALKKAWENAILSSQKEHVTPYIRDNSNGKGSNLFTAINYPCESNYSNIRITVDEIEDFELIKILTKKIGFHQTWKQYTNYIINYGLSEINNNLVRGEGYLNSLKKD